MAKPKIIIIVGATGSGKSALAVDVAKKFNGEVISADSRQIYRTLDIGTAKITKIEMRGVPHHLIDIVDVQDSYTAADFKRDASRAIAEIVSRGNVPIITGGTFFYIDTLLERVNAPEVPPNKELRAKLEAMTEEALFVELQKLDIRRANDIDRRNKRRLVRAIEIASTLGSVPVSEKNDSPYDALTIGLEISKDELRRNYRTRARKWLNDGFLNEVQSLMTDESKRERLMELGFEYQLGLDLVEGKLSVEEFTEAFVQKNWQYAKRQRTWLKRDTSIHWIQPSERGEIDVLIEQFLLH